MKIDQKENDEENEAKKKILSVKAVFDKNNCFDTFKNTQVKGVNIYEPMINNKRLKMKVLRSELLGRYMKIKLIIKLKAVDKILLIMARLRNIELQR
jgi:hypothetical protein